MRRSLLLAAACAAVSWPSPPADARMILMPAISRSCPTAPSWGKLSTCLQHFGKITVRGQRKGARLVDIDGESSGTTGLYLFTQERSGRWRLGGVVRGEGYDASALAPYVIGDSRGYRFDVKQREQRWITLGGVALPAVHHRQFSVFCSGDTTDCEMVTSSCDVFVGGKALWTFRGELSYGAGSIKVSGDRSAAGTECGQPEDVIVPSAAST